MKKTNHKSGFTAVELLITLFIAAAFLVSGYQLYGLIIKDGGQTRAQAKASNTLYDYLQRYRTSATSPCTAQTPLTNSVITVTGLTSVTITVAISCPYGTASPVSKVLATLKYNNPQLSISNATFAKAPSIITDGLVLNFDAADLNSYPGSGTTLFDISGSGKNGILSNGVGYSASNGGALSFDGVSQSQVTISPLSFGFTTAFSAEAWVNSPNVAIDQTIMSRNGPFFLRISASKFRVGIYTGSWVLTNGAIPLTNNTWYHLALTYDGTWVKSYVNGVMDLNVSHPGSMSGLSGVWLGYPSGAGEQYNMNGLIGTARMYNHTLSPIEVQQNFNALRSRYGV